MEQIGTVYVDAGLIMIGDPCYTLPDDGSHRNDIARDWDKFCTASFDENGQTVPAPLGKGIAILVPSGYGDGEYPVYVERNSDGRVISVTVDFSGETDEDED